MGKSQREKGMRFQREVANRFKESGLFPLAYSTGAGQARHNDRSTLKLADIENTDGFFFECKHDEGISPWSALRQAITDAPEGREPVAIVKKNRQGVMVCMSLVTFEKLLLNQKD